MANQKTAVVTGANKGIGREVARRLAKSGHIVWLGCRDQRRGEIAAAQLREGGCDARALSLDVTSDASVAAAAATLGRETDHLDVLVNNAGISFGFDKSPSEEPIDHIRAIYDVNVFGAIRTTQAFLPLLRASPAARIVMMSSGIGSIGKAADPNSEYYAYSLLGYGSSKGALNAATVAFAKELMPFGIKVNAADPGYTPTDINGHAIPARSPEQDARVDMCRTIEQAAEIAVRLATLDADGPTAGFFCDEGAVPW